MNELVALLQGHLGDRITNWFARLWVQRLGRCSHLSHREQVRCWRPWTYQSQCHLHNRTCYTSCDGRPA